MLEAQSMQVLSHAVLPVCCCVSCPVQAKVELTHQALCLTWVLIGKLDIQLTGGLHVKVRPLDVRQHEVGRPLWVRSNTADQELEDFERWSCSIQVCGCSLSSVELLPNMP